MEINKFSGRYSFLSNFYRVSILIIDGKRWPTVEHYYQAMKSDQPPVSEAIRLCPSPGEAKKLGRKVRLRQDWDMVKFSVMRTALDHKFSIKWLENELINTGTADLVEGNYWHDNYWGRCWCKQCAGKPWGNRLGWLLMEIRKEKIENG